MLRNFTFCLLLFFQFWAVEAYGQYTVLVGEDRVWGWGYSSTTATDDASLQAARTQAIANAVTAVYEELDYNINYGYTGEYWVYLDSDFYVMSYTMPYTDQSTNITTTTTYYYAEEYFDVDYYAVMPMWP